MRTSLAVAAGCLMAVAGAVSLTSQNGPTYYKDVLPILQANCQTCHRPGEAAPMSLISYEQSRPWARAIKTAVHAKQMPPWFADPDYGLFANERRLTPAEIQTLIRLGRRRRAGRQPERRRRPRARSRAAGTSSRTSSSRCRSRSSCRRPAPSTTSTSSSRRTSRKTCGSSPPRCGRATRRSCTTARCGCGRPDRRG